MTINILKKSDYVFNFAAIADIEEANQNPVKLLKQIYSV